MTWIGYDIETEGDLKEYALQPWRAREGTGRITLSCCWSEGVSSMVTDRNHQHSILDELRNSKHSRVTLWSGIFDLAWLYASGYNIKGIMWYDAMLLWKWLINGQDAEHNSYSLRNGALEWLQDWPKLKQYLNIKETELTSGVEFQYWMDRVKMDAEATALIAEKIWPLLTSKQQRLATIQAVSLPTVAASWVNGVHIDLDKITAAEAPIIEEMLEIEIKLGLTHPDWLLHVKSNGIQSYVPNKILRSPQQLATLLYSTWKLPCSRFTDKLDQPAADKVALTYLTDLDDRVLDILKWRELNTIWTKFVKGPVAATKYLSSNITHSQPKMFSTYTGRMTYGSKQGKIKIGISLHQTPRKKEIRSYVIAPPGHYIVEFDAAGQEMRGMAVMSEDETMIRVFNSPPPYNNAHCVTGAAIGGWDLEKFLKERTANNQTITSPFGLYQAGKFTNLSIMYRSGIATLRIMARVQYNLNITQEQARSWKNTYLKLYPGVKSYWSKAPQRARLTGCAETPAGRRYGITRYGSDYDWGSESSAINMPIQGMGADQRDLAIAVLVTTYPDLWDKMYFDLHDGLYFFMPYNWPVSFIVEYLKTLNGIDYKKYWDVELPVPYSWDCSFGPNWGSKVSIGIEVPDITIEQYYKGTKK